ncbi:MAG: LXG domain-containing protein [Lachnospiraceae bacterium]|nr:LXG domain-containing protein [Lachnospiraceae bacterium]
MGYDIRYKNMHFQREMYYQNLYTREEQLAEIRNTLLNICNMTEMTGAMADSVRAYIQEIHLPLIEWMLNLIETYRTNLVLYTDYYSKLDSDRMARFQQDCMEDQQQKLMYEKGVFQETADNIQGILREVSGYMDIDGFDPSGVEAAYDNAIAFVDHHKTTIGEYEAVHQAYDLEPVETMLDCIMSILEEQLEGQAGTIETYQSGSIFDRPEYQSAITMSIGMQDYITQKEALVTQCNAFEYQQKKQWDDMVYHRETEAALQIMGAIGMGIVLTVSAVTTALFALPLVFGLYGTTTGIVATGVTTAAYAGAYTYQGSNLIEGVNSYNLAEEGDAAGIAVNPIRDTIFANNPELYYTLGEISTMVALTTPSIASSMNAAVNLGVSPTRAALTEMGMLGGSEIAGRYVEAGVYEQTGDPRLASMARSGTSLLVYGGLAYTDARIGMSGIRHWKTPRVNPLELQPPEQTFTEPNALVNQGNPSTYPAMPGSMSREDIEGYLASLRNESPQGLTADGVSGPGILELGNSDGGVEGGSDIAGNIARNLDTNNIPNMTKQEIIDSIPDNWKYTEYNGFIHIKDETGKIRIRIDPPDKVTQYPHVHVYDNDGNLLDSLGNIVDRKSPDGHIPYKN